jgi:hypothetical protein
MAGLARRPAATPWFKVAGMDFYDSTRPDLIPADTAACLHYDGLYAATPEQAKRFKAVRWITVLGDYRNCGIADFEARLYCDRSNLELVRADLKGLNYLVWIGTLDGNKLSRLDARTVGRAVRGRRDRRL